MIKKLKYIELEYNEEDLDYIDYLSSELDNKSEEIVKFFDEDNIKTKIKLFNDSNLFKEEYKKLTKRDAEKWVCGITYKDGVYVLSLSQLRKTYNHENNNKEDLLKLILHEFIHSIHYKKVLEKPITCFSEGLATYLSGQYPDADDIKVSYDDLINKTCSYTNYRAIVKYIIENYDHDYILKLINDNNFLLSESKKLYEESLNK